MWHTLLLYRRLMSVQMRSQMQYRAAFVLEMLSTAVIVAVEFGSVALVLNRFGGIQGWTLAEVAFLYGMSETAFGFMDTQRSLKFCEQNQIWYTH